MHACAGWLMLNELEAPKVNNVISAFSSDELGCLISPPFSCNVLRKSESMPTGKICLSGKLLYKSESYKNIVVPALAGVFDNVNEVQHLLCSHVEFRALSSSSEVPYTICQGSGQSPVILMDWHGQPEDLICLAHETAHALQMLLSKNELMPPVARETCVFIGEQLLLDYVASQVPHLHNPLLDVWHSKTVFIWVTVSTF